MHLCACMHILVYTKMWEPGTHNKRETTSTYPRWLCWHIIQCTARKHRIFQINKTILSYILNKNLITGLIAQSWLNLGSQLLFNHSTIAALLMIWEATAMVSSMKSPPMLRESDITGMQREATASYMWALEVENVKVRCMKVSKEYLKQNEIVTQITQMLGWERIICAFKIPPPLKKKLLQKITTENGTSWNFFLRLWHAAKPPWQRELAQISALSLSGFLYTTVVYPTPSSAPQLLIFNKSHSMQQKTMNPSSSFLPGQGKKTTTPFLLPPGQGNSAYSLQSNSESSLVAVLRV